MPAYNLRDVYEAANMRQIEYRGRRVFLDTANLGYELENVAKCIMDLREDDFYKTHEYDDRPADDAYRTRFPRPDGDEGEMDELYIKFSLVNDGTIDLASFHSQ